MRKFRIITFLRPVYLFNRIIQGVRSTSYTIYPLDLPFFIFQIQEGANTVIRNLHVYILKINKTYMTWPNLTSLGGCWHIMLNFQFSPKFCPCLCQIAITWFVVLDWCPRGHCHHLCISSLTVIMPFSHFRTEIG